MPSFHPGLGLDISTCTCCGVGSWLRSTGWMSHTIRLICVVDAACHPCITPGLVLRSHQMTVHSRSRGLVDSDRVWLWAVQAQRSRRNPRQNVWEGMDRVAGELPDIGDHLKSRAQVRNPVQFRLHLKCPELQCGMWADSPMLCWQQTVHLLFGYFVAGQPVGLLVLEGRVM